MSLFDAYIWLLQEEWLCLEWLTQAEYEAKMVMSAELVMHGRFYVTSSFFCFHAEQRNKYTLVGDDLVHDNAS